MHGCRDLDIFMNNEVHNGIRIFDSDTDSIFIYDYEVPPPPPPSCVTVR